jgi:hypothetical protein
MIEVSEKFEKDLARFNEWLDESGYRIMQDERCKMWGLELLDDFKEQGRNKLDHYLKELMKAYKIVREGEIVEDYKLVVKEFKETKPKRSKPASRQQTTTTTLYKDADISKLNQEIKGIKEQISGLVKHLERMENMMKSESRPDPVVPVKQPLSPEVSDLFGEIDLNDISDVDFSD